MESKKTKKEADQSQQIETSSTINYLDKAIYDVDSAILNLNKQYEIEAENPISSALISLELIQMNLNKIKSN